MKKILVTTDFSVNSKAGIKFAIQMSLQEKVKLTFFHSYYIMRPTSWADSKFVAYEKAEKAKLQTQLTNFVSSVYKSMKVDFKNVDCVLSEAINADSNIRDYAKKHKFDFICISTRGAGKLKKLFGTNTSTIIKNSRVPVIAVPSNFKVGKLRDIIYASDLEDLDKELKVVIDFNKDLKANIELLHFDFPAELQKKEKAMEAAKKKFSKQKIKLHLENVNIAESFLTNLENAIRKSKPSLLVMFRHTQQSFFDRIFVPSYSAEFSYTSKVPLLIFGKP